jgi:hypothetical protein
LDFPYLWLAGWAILATVETVNLRAKFQSSSARVFSYPFMQSAHVGSKAQQFTLITTLEYIRLLRSGQEDFGATSKAAINPDLSSQLGMLLESTSYTSSPRLVLAVLNVL